MFPDGVQKVQIYSMRHSRPLRQLHKYRQTVNQTDIRHCIDHDLHSKVFLVWSCISPLTLGIFDQFFNIFPYWNQVMWNYFPVLTDSSYSYVIFSFHVNLSTFWEQSPDFTASSNIASGKMRGEVMEEVASHLLIFHWVFRQTCLLLFNTTFNVVRQLLQCFALLGEKEEKGRKNIK